MSDSERLEIAIIALNKLMRRISPPESDNLIASADDMQKIAADALREISR